MQNGKPWAGGGGERAGRGGGGWKGGVKYFVACKAIARALGIFQRRDAVHYYAAQEVPASTYHNTVL